jgi:hypothetical protein
MYVHRVLQNPSDLFIAASTTSIPPDSMAFFLPVTFLLITLRRAPHAHFCSVWHLGNVFMILTTPSTPPIEGQDGDYVQRLG